MRSARHLLLRAYEMGVGGFDTAPMYAQGFAERALAKTVVGRPEVRIITKAGRHPTLLGMVLQRLRMALRKGRPDRHVFEARPDAVPGSDRALTSRAYEALRRQILDVDFRSEAIERSVRSSSRRLNMHPLDVVVLHSPPAASSFDGAMSTLSRLSHRGHIREVGVSVATQNELAMVLDRSVPVPDGHKHLLIPQRLFRPNQGPLLRLQESDWILYGTQPFADYDSSETSSAEHLRNHLDQGFDRVIFGTTDLQHLEENLLL